MGGLNDDNIVLPTAEDNILNENEKNTAKKLFCLIMVHSIPTYPKLNLVPFKQEKIAVNVFGRTEESKVQNIDVKFIVISGRKNVFVGA